MRTPPDAVRRPAGRSLRRFLGAFLLVVGSAEAQERVDLRSLLTDMLDRDRVARTAAPWFTCAQASSYDRRSVAADRPGWFANADRSQFVRTETPDGRTEHVLLDAAGPGAIVRIWGTWHGPGGGEFSNGTLRVYFDGAAEPTIAGPIADLLSGERLVGPPLAHSVAPQTEYARRGHNLYLPIPYARHCKITYETEALIDVGAVKGEALYYQINYRTYAAGTEVRTFSSEQLAELGPLVEKVQAALALGAATAETGLRTREFDGPLAAGAQRAVELEGPGAVRHLALRVDAEDREQALRSTVVEVRCDGERTVWCPVEALFGCGYRAHPTRTWYTTVDADGLLVSRWIMPFERTCEVVVHNLGSEDVRLSHAAVMHGAWDWDARSLHFHAAWRQYGHLDTRGGRENNSFDLNYVTLRGQGHYVGDTLTVFNASSAWWGEGDEKIYVDGETFPSHFGTGTEDYYGYAWCREEPFANAFHAQPTGAGNMTPGLSVNTRYRILDEIPFRTSLRVDMEMWHWVQTKVDFSPASLWYARPGGSSNVAPDPAGAARAVIRSREDLVPPIRVAGAIEGETLEVIAKSGGVTEIQDIPQFGWSGDRQLWWRGGALGDRLELAFPCAAAGRYRVRANLTKARDYGLAELSINGAAVAVTFDRYHPDVEHDVVELGTFDLREGDNRLTVRIAGANPAAVPAYMFGLDYLLLEPVR